MRGWRVAELVVGEAVQEPGNVGLHLFIVRSYAPCSVQHAGPPVADRHVRELRQLRFIGEAPGQGPLGEVLPVWVVEGESGELLCASDAGGAVAPARAARTR